MADGLNEQAFTVKDWLQRIDAKQDTLDEKIDKVSQQMDRKADDRDLRALQDRVLVTEQQANQRLDMWKKLDSRLSAAEVLMHNQQEMKADRVDVGALWKVLVGTLSGVAIAILAWALQFFH